MGGDGISKVVSRKLPPPDDERRERRFEPSGAEAAADEDEVRAA